MLIASSSHLTPAGQPAAISRRAVAPMAMNAVSVIEVCLVFGWFSGWREACLWVCSMVLLLKILKSKKETGKAHSKAIFLKTGKIRN